MKLMESFIADIRQLIASARATVARRVDLIQEHTSFEIGQPVTGPVAGREQEASSK